MGRLARSGVSTFAKDAFISLSSSYRVATVAAKTQERISGVMCSMLAC